MNGNLPGSNRAYGQKDYLTHKLNTELELLKVIHFAKTGSRKTGKDFSYVVIDTIAYCIKLLIGHDSRLIFSVPGFVFDEYQDWTRVQKLTVEVKIQADMLQHFPTKEVRMFQRQLGRSAFLTMEETRLLVNECVRKSNAFAVML